MDLIREIDTLLAGRCERAEGLGENFRFPAIALSQLPQIPCADYLSGVFSDEAEAYTNYRYDVNFDSLAYLDRWLIELRSKMDKAGGGAMRALVFDYVWVLGAYASDVRIRGDASLGLQIFREAFEVGKLWPRSWAFASLLRRFPPFLSDEEADIGTMVLLYAQDVFRLTDRYQAALTLLCLAGHRTRLGEWEAVESHGLEAVLAAENLFVSHRGSDLLCRMGYGHLCSAQLQLGKFKDLTQSLDVIPQLVGVTGHDLLNAGLFRAAMYWELGEVEQSRRIYARELDRVSVRFPDLRVMVLFYWAFMEVQIGDPRRSQELIARAVADLEGDPSYRGGLERILKAQASFEVIADEVLQIGMPAMTPPRILEYRTAA